MFMFASTVMAKDKLLRLKDWDQVLCSSSRGHAPTATVRARNCTPLAMYARLISK
jgi:hypothetical protein